MDVAIVGASGYGGRELIWWLSHHPEARVKVAVSESSSGRLVSDVFPGLKGLMSLECGTGLEKAKSCDVVFLAAEGGFAMKHAQELLLAGCKVIDLSADLRFKDSEDWEVWYGGKHCAPALASQAAYGLPELNKAEISGSSLVGNPGCYTTSAILALAPLVSHGLIDVGTIVIDGKSGVSGAGRSKQDLQHHFPECNESVAPYKAGGTHRHTGEIEQELSRLARQPIRVSFTPHLVPMTRGVLTSSYAGLKSSTSAATLRDLFRGFYSNAPFVQVVDEPPATKHTMGSNMVHISVSVDSRTHRVSVFSALDNLGKGMAGQAVQNMNLMCGLPETMGLEVLPLWP
jgi:N-acetyl-gamma-glutamyl-phosphate reductase